MAAARLTRPAIVIARPVRAAVRCTTLIAYSVKAVKISPVPYTLISTASRYTRCSREEGTSDLRACPGFSLGIVTSFRESRNRTSGQPAAHNAGQRPHVIRFPRVTPWSAAANLPDCAAHSAPGDAARRISIGPLGPGRGRLGAD